MPKAIMPESFYGRRELSAIDDECWNRLKKHFPTILTDEADALLRSRILECCSWFLTENGKVKESRRTFAAMQRGKRQPSVLERLANGLRVAADAWANIRRNPHPQITHERKVFEYERGIHDDRVTDISRFDGLEAMAADANRRLAALSALKPQNTNQPFGEFVRKVARYCCEAGLEPGVTGRLYERDAKPTWFQKFIIALDRDLLGTEGPWPTKRKSSFDKGKAASIAKALLSYKKSGKARN
jgi:hypothetical protein